MIDPIISQSPDGSKRPTNSTVRSPGRKEMEKQ
jgi:hypothetical protein